MKFSSLIDSQIEHIESLLLSSIESERYDNFQAIYEEWKEYFETDDGDNLNILLCDRISKIID